MGRVTFLELVISCRPPKFSGRVLLNQAGKGGGSYRTGSGVGGDGDDAVAALGVAAEDGLRPLAGAVLLAPPLPIVRPVTLVEERLPPRPRGDW